MLKIISQPINPAEVIAFMRTPSSGGIDVFLGQVRNISKGREVTKLYYEAYEPLALKTFQQIEAEMHEQWELEKIAMVHRIGMMNVFEDAVIVAVSAVHRKEAFEACRYGIDNLKKRAAIWKKEFFADGSVVADMPNTAWSANDNISLKF